MPVYQRHQTLRRFRPETGLSPSPGSRMLHHENDTSPERLRSESPVSKRTIHSLTDSEGRDHKRLDGAMLKPVTREKGILDPYKSRYMSQNSVVAFPRELAADLHSATPLPLHSFAYHCCMRPEEPATSHIPLSSLLSHGEFAMYIDAYYTAVHPLFGFLEQDHFLQRCESYWNGTNPTMDFSAVIAGVAALGSFFSIQSHPREQEILLYAKGVLEDSAVQRRPTIDQVCAWILRTIYLRATTRPHVAWLASSVTMHLAEAIGLHHDVGAIVLTTDATPGHPISSDERGLERARAVFWASWTANKLTAYEYGRSSVKLESITCKQLRPSPGSSFLDLVRISQLIPPESANCDKDELLRALQAMKGINDSSEMITLTKADIAFAFYRRLRLLRQGLEKDVITDIISLGNRGVSAAYILAQQHRPWWNVLGAVFQYFCVLLAVDTSETLAHVSWVLETFEKIVDLLGRPHLAAEALDTARQLLRDSVKKKKQDLSLLEVATGIGASEQMEDVGIDWDAVFSTYPPISLSQEFMTNGVLDGPTMM